MTAPTAEPDPSRAKPTETSPPKPPSDKDEAVDDSAKEAPSTAESQVDPDANETKLFDERAILYRFDKEAKD
jgi:hypothetical protein